MMIAGFDISSFRLDCCVLADDHPPSLRHEVIGTDKTPLVDRIRAIPEAVMRLLAFLPGNDELEWVVIEEPAGKYGAYALLPVLGAITACVPPETQVGWRKASEWRSDLGAKNSKLAGHEAVLDLISDDHLSLVRHANGHVSFDEHELDAAGLTYAWRRLLEANVLGETP